MTQTLPDANPVFGGIWALGVGSICNTKTLEPLFHCNAHGFAVGACVGIGPQCETFALLIPTSWLGYLTIVL